MGPMFIVYCMLPIACCSSCGLPIAYCILVAYCLPLPIDMGSVDTDMCNNIYIYIINIYIYTYTYILFTTLRPFDRAKTLLFTALRPFDTTKTIKNIAIRRHKSNHKTNKNFGHQSAPQSAQKTPKWIPGGLCPDSVQQIPEVSEKSALKCIENWTQIDTISMTC